jgi:Xaa-Pro dipeptidase
MLTENFAAETALASRFSEAEYNRRYQLVRQLMESHGLRCLVLYGNRGQGSLFHYLANFSPRWESFLLFPLEGEPLLLVQLYNHLPDARQNSVIADTRWGGPNSLQTLLQEMQARGFTAGPVGIAGALPYQSYTALRRHLPQADFQDVSRELIALRQLKSLEEIARLRAAARLTDLALESLAAGLQPGMRESELVALMQCAVQQQGGTLELCYLASTSMADPSACVPAQNPGSRRIWKGDVVISEIGSALGGYAGQIHRPLAVGTPPTPTYQALYETALEAYQQIAAVIRPGATSQDVYAAAEVIHQRGYTIYDDLVHGFGGGYLEPVLRTSQTAHGQPNPFTFRENMCVVIQPNVISLDHRAGVQVGQLHLVTTQGLESLQHFPLEFIVVR